MKRATREHIANLSIGATYTSDRAVWLDVLNSDDRQRAEIRDLKARLATANKCLEVIAQDHPVSCPDAGACDQCYARTTLSKTRRKP